MEIDEIIHQTQQYRARYITVTGGEPLAQPACHTLLSRLCDDGYSVSLETGGAIDISQVDPRVYIVLDVKTPASGEEPNNLYDNLQHIKQTDCLKFVICDKEDYQWSSQFVKEHDLSASCDVFFSPSAEQLNPTDLADWIVEDQLPVRLQIQLHKLLWANEPGR